MLSGLVPQLCVACDRAIEPTPTWLCARCRAVVFVSGSERSRRLDLGEGKSIRVQYALEYTPTVSKIITEMKYGDKPGLARLLSSLLCLAIGETVPSEAVVVPVPMYHSRKRERGYNQSEILARKLGQAKDLPVLGGLLVKRRNTRSQASLERDNRLRNVVGSFSLKSGKLRSAHLLASKHILLVDDVVTTGSTVKECAWTLIRQGFEEISACVVASSMP